MEDWDVKMLHVCVKSPPWVESLPILGGIPTLPPYIIRNGQISIF